MVRIPFAELQKEMANGNLSKQGANIRLIINWNFVTPHPDLAFPYSANTLKQPPCRLHLDRKANCY